MQPVWGGGFSVLVPAAHVDEAKDLLSDVRSTARPLFPRAIAIIFLILFVAPLIVSALAALDQR